MRWTLAVLCALTSVQALWPAPSQMQQDDKYIKLHESFTITAAEGFAVPGDLLDATTAALKQLKDDKMKALVVDLAGVETAAKAATDIIESLSLKLTAAGGARKKRATHTDIRRGLHKRDASSITSEINKSYAERDESYTLDIELGNEVASLSAPTTLGLLRGLQTFTQLVYTTSGEEAVRYIRNAPISIQDKAAYPIRGLLLDTARNFYPVKDIKRTLDAMSYAKMNYFHWHITDSQAWPLVIPSHPELSEKAAYYDDQVYNLETVTEVIYHANAIGIEVMIEIDTPGHTASIAMSHPELVSCTEDPWAKVAAQPNPGQIKPTSDEALTLVNDVYIDVMTAIPGKLFGTGGDEVNWPCFENDTSVQTVLQQKGQNISQSIASFITGTHKTVFDAGKIPVVWEESAIGKKAVPLDPNVIVTAWSANDALANITAAGYKAIQASVALSYLDCGMGGWVALLPHWCAFVSWWTMYTSLETLAPLSDAQKKLVLGGQASLWSEQAGPEVVDSLIWPRAAAVGEVWWLGEQGMNGEGLKNTTALGRLHDFRYRLVQRGIAAKPLQPHWCALRPEKCLL